MEGCGPPDRQGGERDTGALLRQSGRSRGHQSGALALGLGIASSRTTARSRQSLAKEPSVLGLTNSDGIAHPPNGVVSFDNMLSSGRLRASSQSSTFLQRGEVDSNRGPTDRTKAHHALADEAASAKCDRLSIYKSRMGA